MTDDGISWAWFDEHHMDKTLQSTTSLDLQRAFARLLAYPEAETILEHLHAITRDRICGPNASDAVLRYLDGQKALVAYMERMALKGRGDRI